MMRNINEIQIYLKESVYNKPFLSTEEQLVLLKSRGLIIENEKFAIEQLNTISYYSLINAYSDIFKKDKNNFQQETYFSDIFNCYRYDNKLRYIFFKYILLIEQSLKTNLATIVAKSYGINEPKSKIENPRNNRLQYERSGTYLDTKHYDSHKRNRAGILNDISKSLDWKKHNSIKHYQNNHNHVPPWIIILPHNFGITIRWFSILNPNQKLLTVSNMSSHSKNQDKFNLISVNIMNLLREFRNIIAHGQRFYSYRTTDDEAIISRSHFNNLIGEEFLKVSEYKNNIGKNDLFALAISILLFTKNESVRSRFINELENVYLSMEKKNKVNLLKLIALNQSHIDKLKNLNRIFSE